MSLGRVALVALRVTLPLLIGAFGCTSPEGAPAQASLNIAGNLLVANQSSSSATLIDLRTGTSKTIAVPDGPHETAVSADGRVGIVTIFGGRRAAGHQLAVIDMSKGVVARIIPLGRYTRPHGVAFLPGDNDRVVVTSQASRTAVVVDVAKGVVESAIGTEAAGSHMIAVTASGQRAFTANTGSGSISEIDLPTRRFVRAIEVAPSTEGIAVVPDGSAVWVGSNTDGTVTVVETRTGSVVAVLGGFEQPYRLAISPDGRIAIICDAERDRIHVADVQQGKVLWTLDGRTPRGVTISPDASIAFVTLAGERSVAVVDLRERRFLSKFSVGKSPDGVAFGPTP